MPTWSVMKRILSGPSAAGVIHLMCSEARSSEGSSHFLTVSVALVAVARPATSDAVMTMRRQIAFSVFVVVSRYLVVTSNGVCDVTPVATSRMTICHLPVGSLSASVTDPSHRPPGARTLVA